MNRREFIYKTSLFTGILLISTNSFSDNERFKVPKQDKEGFEKLRIQLAYRPYNVDLITALLKFNQRIDTSAFKDRSLKNLLIFLYANTRNKEIMEKLKEAIWNPVIQSKKEVQKLKKLQKEGKGLGRYRILDQKKELKRYRKQDFRNSYETLVFYRLAEFKELEKKMREDLENSNRNFNSRAQDIYYKTLYYTLIGDTPEAKYTLSTVIKEIESTYNREVKRKEREKEREKRFGTESLRRYGNSFNLREIYFMYTVGLGAFLYRNSNEEKFHKYSQLAKDFSKVSNKPDWSYFYQMYAIKLIYKEYDSAIEYLEVIKREDPYKGINVELFAVNTKSAIQNLKLKKWKEAWLSSKNGIEIGMDLNYNKYYTTVIFLKKIFRNSGLEYIRQLISTNNREIAKEVYEETNRILRLTKST